MPTSEIVSSQQEAIVKRAITNGALRYIEGCESRIDEFVKTHYSFRGALRTHTHAFGWDLIKVPINIIWSVINIFLALIGVLFKLLRLTRLSNWIGQIPPGLETAMDRQINWLVITELLQLPHQQGVKQSNKDALMEEIMRDPDLMQLLNEELEAFSELSKEDNFRARLDKKLTEYSATRTGSADLAGSAVLLITSHTALGHASYGALSAGSTVSASIAHSIAVSNFLLGSTAGSLYYAFVPVAASLRLVIAVTAVVAIVMAFISTFIGIVTDPIQAKLGIHQRRLRKLVAAVCDDLSGNERGTFALREKYMGRVFDLVDVLSTVGRTF